MFRELTENFDFQWAQTGLDAAMLRQKTISNNIANINTPTYNRQFVSFEEKLRALVDGDADISGKMTHRDHIPIDPVGLKWAQPSVHSEDWTAMRNDENNIDIDREMGDMAKNSIMYQFLLKRVSSKFTTLNTVIQRGGGRA